MTILCITPNSNLERTWLVPGLQLSGAFRVEKVVLLPSGKGINAARAIHTLQGEAFCMGFLGGGTGKLIASMVEQLGIPARWTWIAGESRLSVVIKESASSRRDALLLSEPGPQVNHADWSRLRADVSAAAESAGLACIMGSVPQGTDYRDLGDLILSLKARRIPVWADCDGAALESVLCAQPDGLKINLHEAASLLGLKSDGLPDAVQAASALRQRGIKTVILTMGASGAVLVGEGLQLRGFTPPQPAISSVGSGDAFMAGLLNGLAQGLGLEPAFRQGLSAGAANTLKLGAADFDLDDYRKILPTVQIEAISG